MQMAYLVQVVINFLVSLRRWRIEKKHNMARFMSIGKGSDGRDEEKREQSRRSFRYWLTGTASVEIEGGVVQWHFVR